MVRRAPSAKFLTIGVLDDFRFVLRNYADIVHTKGYKTYGVVWSISIDDLHALDRDEGYHDHYNRIPVDVETPHGLLRASAHVMDPEYRETRGPTEDYVRLIYQGYREHGIPVEQLKDAVALRLYQD